MITDAGWMVPAVFLIALATMALLTRFVNIPLPEGRLQAIDGLRGFLALSVFIYHATLWQTFLQSGKWQVPSSPFAAHLGQSSVSLFFMITGCLFFGRILDARERPIEWGRLYVSRCMRILPLFILTSLIGHLIAGVIILSGLDTGNPSFIPDTARRLLITAGVTWTLHYEWLFYFSLPWLALASGKRAPLAILLLTGLMLAFEKWSRINPVLLLNFAGGMAAAILIRHPRLRAALGSRPASALALVAIALAINFCPDPFSATAIGILWIPFCIIAAGNSLFGLLSLRVCRQLGEITFGIYLLHGFLLFTILRLGLGLQLAESLTPRAYEALMLSITPILIGLALLSFVFLEVPCMRTAPQAHAWLSGKAQILLNNIKRKNFFWFRDK